MQPRPINIGDSALISSLRFFIKDYKGRERETYCNYYLYLRRCGEDAKPIRLYWLRALQPSEEM